MQNVNIKILNTNHPSFQDTTKGKIYSATVLEDGELLPLGFNYYEGQVNEGGRSINFFDDVGDDCATNLDGTLNIFYEIVE